MEIVLSEPKHREHMIGLLFKVACSCPGRRKADCPFAECRKPSKLREQYDLINAMEIDDLEMVYLYHQNCRYRQSAAISTVAIS